MKKLNNIIIGFVLLVSLVSCTDELKLGNDFLDKMPGEDITIDTVFSKKLLAENFLWNAYSTLYYGLNWDWSDRGNKMGMGLPESLTDNFQSYLTWDGVYKIYYTGKYNATEENNNSAYNYKLEGSWEGIRKSWIFIENVDRVPDMDVATKALLKAEARMIIACHYADMFRHFGGLPLVKKSFKPNDDMALPRSTAKETLDFITNQCDSALKVLPWKLHENDSIVFDGRFTGGAALGLKIRILLFAASPLFNDDVPYYTSSSYASIDNKQVWFGRKDPTMWNDVISACELFNKLNNDNDAQGGIYRLVKEGETKYPAFTKAYFTRGNSEMLISTRIRYSVPDYWNDKYYCLQSLGSYGAAVPTMNYGDLFPMADGTPFDKTVWNDTLGVYKVKAPGDTTFTSPFADRDPRLYQTCLVNDVDYQGRKSQLWMGGLDRGNTMESGAAPTGMGVYKFLLERDKGLSQSIGAPAHWPYLRLAEIYLSYAEALHLRRHRHQCPVHLRQGSCWPSHIV